MALLAEAKAAPLALWRGMACREGLLPEGLVEGCKFFQVFSSSRAVVCWRVLRFAD